MHICYCQVLVCDTGFSLSLAGGSDVYAVLVCGNDPSSPKNAAIFQRDLLGFKSVLTDNRIVGVRYTKSCRLQHSHCLLRVILMFMPKSTCNNLSLVILFGS